METNKILEKQLELLSKASETTLQQEDWDSLNELSKSMAAIAQVLRSEQNRSFYGASTNHPYVVQLPVKDLIDLYAARYKQAHSSGQTHEL